MVTSIGCLLFKVTCTFRTIPNGLCFCPFIPMRLTFELSSIFLFSWSKHCFDIMLPEEPVSTIAFTLVPHISASQVTQSGTVWGYSFVFLTLPSPLGSAFILLNFRLSWLILQQLLLEC